MGRTDTVELLKGLHVRRGCGLRLPPRDARQEKQEDTATHASFPTKTVHNSPRRYSKPTQLGLAANLGRKTLARNCQKCEPTNGKAHLKFATRSTPSWAISWQMLPFNRATLLSGLTVRHITTDR